MNAKFIEKLKDIAQREAWVDNKEFSVFDFCGGNFDDAYSGGVDDGEILLAREVLKEIGENNLTETI